MRRVWAILLLLILPALLAASQLDTLILFKSWLDGNPKALIRLNVEIPKVYADKCFLAVHRFPSPLNPTKDRYSEVVYRGIVPCGSIFTVKSFINMIQAGVKVERGEVKPVYAVVVITSNGQSFSRIIQTSVERPVTDVNVKAELKKPETTLGKAFKSQEDALGYYKPSSCPIEITYNDGITQKGGCVAWTKLAYLNSIPGLSVSFGLWSKAPPSAMYIEGQSAACIVTEGADKPCPPSYWGSAGKKLTKSVTEDTTYPVSNGYRAIVWGQVAYNYEHYYYADWGFDWVYDFLYPAYIKDLDKNPQIIGYYQKPSSPPWCAFGPAHGNQNYITFTPVYNSNDKLQLSTSMNVSIPIYGFSVSVSVSPYKAGSDQYATPYINIVDTSGRNYNWYYWWYKDCDAIYYELEFWG